MNAEYIDRRNFTRRLAQYLTYGGLAHFSLSSSARAATSQEDAYKDCPGGLSPTDVCNPPVDYDYCPGEKAPADDCPADGNKEEDLCMSGLEEADVCNPRREKSDQCSSGAKADDLCPQEIQRNDDKCYSGSPKDDECPPNGGKDEDDCPGGGLSFDTCNPEGAGPSGGDECSDGSYGSEDDCKPSTVDRCGAFDNGWKGLWDDDTCLTGKNAPHSISLDGPDDWCAGNWFSSDSCWSGTDEDDLCIGNGGTHGEYDECPGGDSNLDKCGVVGDGALSDDYCVAGSPESDECPGGTPPEDECAGGMADEDVCYMHTIGSDECDRNIAGSDQGGCKKWEDECFAYDICTFTPALDVAE